MCSNRANAQSADTYINGNMGRTTRSKHTCPQSEHIYAFIHVATEIYIGIELSFHSLHTSSQIRQRQRQQESKTKQTNVSHTFNTHFGTLLLCIHAPDPNAADSVIAVDAAAIDAVTATCMCVM